MQNHELPILLHLRRQNSKQFWGFRLHGGVDYHSALTIVHVVPSGIANRMGIRVGDEVIKIGNKDTHNMSHEAAQEAIRASENSLDLLLVRKATIDNNAADITVSNKAANINQRSPYIVTNDFSDNDFKPISQEAPAFSSSRGINLPPGSPLSPTSSLQSPHSQCSSPSLKGFNNLDEFIANRYNTYSPPSRSTNTHASYSSITFNPHRSPRPDTNLRNLSTDINSKKQFTFQQPSSPTCWKCNAPLSGGPYLQALGRFYCQEHFTCDHCGRRLANSEFVEENGRVYCEQDFQTLLAPQCAKCRLSILGEIINAMEKQFHPHCFVCTHCRQPISSCSFRIGDDKFPYCERDWNDLFLTRCQRCHMAVEPSDRFIEAFDGVFHAECFCCEVCGMCLEGAPFYAKDGKAFCKQHARPT